MRSCPGTDWYWSSFALPNKHIKQHMQRQYRTVNSIKPSCQGTAGDSRWRGRWGAQASTGSSGKESHRTERDGETSLINLLTPVPPVTGHDKSWPLFHVWLHRLWPKLASVILNFCSRKRFFQWYPESEICTKILRHLSEKFRAKFPVTYMWYSTVKIAHLDDVF